MNIKQAEKFLTKFMEKQHPKATLMLEEMIFDVVGNEKEADNYKFLLEMYIIGEKMSDIGMIELAEVLKKVEGFEKVKNKGAAYG